jgi:hypothetical protein
MFKLRIMIASCALVLTVGTASATSINISFFGTGGSSTLSIAPSPPVNDSLQIHIAPVSGSASPCPSSGCIPPFIFDTLSISLYDQQDNLVGSGTVGFDFVCGVSGPGNTINCGDMIPEGSGSLTLPTDAAYVQLSNELSFGGDVDISTSLAVINDSFDTVQFTEIAGLPTPLPATLPLFASGLGALGLLGWRRKRKASAALAAA